MPDTRGRTSTSREPSTPPRILERQRHGARHDLDHGDLRRRRGASLLSTPAAAAEGQDGEPGRERRGAGGPARRDGSKRHRSYLPHQ